MAILEWKIRQEIFHRLNTNHDDDLKLHDVVIDEDIIQSSIKYFKTTELGWVYPAKSYVVGICYARWISYYFQESFYEVLDDPSLLYNNDPYFVPYRDDKYTYDCIISQIGLDFDESCGIIPDIKSYFLKEFQLDESRV
jgi:hypothetical protein